MIRVWVDPGLERTFVMALVVAPALFDDVPDIFDGDSLADFRALAVWYELGRLADRGVPVTVESVRRELETRFERRDLYWYERPSPSWPWSMTDTAFALAEQLAHNPRALPMREWSWSLMRIAARRRDEIAAADRAPQQGQRLETGKFAGLGARRAA